MVSGLPLILLLAAGTPAWDARAELNAVATRIEQLKVRHMAGEDVGRELVALLVRAQELAGEIERREARAPMPPPAPASELRERADALHDEADRIVSALTAVEGRIVQAHQAMTARAQRGDAGVSLLGEAAGVEMHEAQPGERLGGEFLPAGVTVAADPVVEVAQAALFDLRQQAVVAKTSVLLQERPIGRVTTKPAKKRRAARKMKMKKAA